LGKDLDFAIFFIIFAVAKTKNAVESANRTKETEIRK